LALEGALDGGGNLRRGADGRISGHATINSPAGAFAESKGNDAVRLEYRDFGVEMELASDVARARLHAVLPKQGELTGTLTLATAQADPGLSGNASLKLRDLAPLGWWLPQLASLRGGGELGAEFAGTLAAPRMTFRVRGTGLDAEVPMLGLHLRDGSVDAGIKPGGEFEAQGSISSGEGVLRLSGARDPQRGLELKFSGNNLLAASIPGARVTIAPDLALSGKLDALALTGSVKIESADVNLEKLSFGKSSRTSSDVVVVDREQGEQGRSLGLRTDVRVIIGEQVKLAGFGLDATVAGELRVREQPDQPSRANGEIRLAGTYEAFGRKLNIERGRLQFADTALDDPQLDILAIRKLQDVTAKLRVTGTAQNPKLDVFADPAMSQTDAMSYLLTGKPASDLHGEDGATVQNAAQQLSTIVGYRLAKRFGGKMSFVDSVGVEQNADLGGSAFTVGKYLSPRLFVSYGVGLFEPGSAVTVRYEFSERWSLEANDTPEDQHAGVRYRIEK
jgi:translocation and assembly module TamB